MAGISEDNAQSLLGQLFIFRTIFQPRALSSDIPASRKGVYLFYNLQNNFSRRTSSETMDFRGKACSKSNSSLERVDSRVQHVWRLRVMGSCSSIFCGFFSSFSVRNCQPDFYLAVTGSCKTSFLVFLVQLKVSSNVCLFLGFPSVGIKSDNGYQIGRRISSVSIY